MDAEEMEHMWQRLVLSTWLVVVPVAGAAQVTAIREGRLVDFTHVQDSTPLRAIQAASS